jgi:enamine deaminase RidA (YjgF/YER057c/UK114 family)
VSARALPRLLAAFLALTSLAAAEAAEVTRHKAIGANAPILLGATVPAGAALTFLSGQVPPVVNAAAPANSIEAYGDTRTQTIGVFTRIKAALEGMGLGLGDVVKMTVFLVADPAQGGRLGFRGFSEGYAQFFGAPEQPNLVTRSTMQVAALVNPGWLVEIEVIAAK